MANENEYRVIIEVQSNANAESTETKTPLEEVQSGKEAKSAEVSQKKTEASAKKGNIAKALAIQYARQGVMSAVSNYGDMTGDYQTQQTLSAAIDLAMSTATIIANPYIGIPAAIAKYGGQAFSYIKQQKTSERTAKFLAQRVGYNVY